jgi:hypothetical protein
MRPTCVIFLHIQYESLESPEQFPRPPVHKGIDLFDSLPYPKHDHLRLQSALNGLEVVLKTYCDDDELCSRHLIVSIPSIRSEHADNGPSEAEGTHE